MQWQFGHEYLPQFVPHADARLPALMASFTVLWLTRYGSFTILPLGILVALVHFRQEDAERMKFVITFSHTVNRFRDLRNGFLLRPHLGDFSVGEWSVGRTLVLCGACGLLRLRGCFGQLSSSWYRIVGQL
jgi:hypothetical protein